MGSAQEGRAEADPARGPYRLTSRHIPGLFSPAPLRAVGRYQHPSPARPQKQSTEPLSLRRALDCPRLDRPPDSAGSLRLGPPTLQPPGGAQPLSARNLGVGAAKSSLRPGVAFFHRPDAAL